MGGVCPVGTHNGQCVCNCSEKDKSSTSLMGFWSKKMNFKNGVQSLQVIEELETLTLFYLGVSS